MSTLRLKRCKLKRIVKMTSDKDSSSSASPTYMDMGKEPGKKMPMMEVFSNFSMIGVGNIKDELKFVHVRSEKYRGKFLVMLFMDNKLTKLEIEEFQDFSNRIKDFKSEGASLVGVCTDSHVTMRAMMMDSLKEVKFPIISDRDGDFSRSFGVLKVGKGEFGAARAIIILDPEMKMIYMDLRNEQTKAHPDKVLDFLKHIKRVRQSTGGLQEGMITRSVNGSMNKDSLNGKPNSSTENGTNFFGSPQKSISGGAGSASQSATITEANNAPQKS